MYMNNMCVYTTPGAISTKGGTHMTYNPVK